MKFDLVDWEEGNADTCEESRLKAEDYHEESMMIPSLDDETKDQRARRILQQIKSSTKRLDQILGVFDRINR